MARKARYDEAELMGMLSDVDSDDGDYLEEPMCPGSDDEFPCPDSDDERYSMNSNNHYTLHACPGRVS